MPTGSILVVDDDEATLGLLVRFLSSLGCVVLSAKNGDEALHLLSDNQSGIGLVLMDIAMPQMSGLILAQTIREEIDSDLPLIALTARIGPEIEADAAAAGINGVIRKPFEPKLLRETLKEVGFLP